MTQTGILDLSICDFLHLNTYLDASSKYNLSRTCRYLENIMNYPLMWKQSDEIKATVSSKEEVAYLIEKIWEKTRKVLLRGKRQEGRYIPLTFFKKLRSFDNLTVLVLERLSFDVLMPDSCGKLECLGMKIFPSTLKELSLKGTTWIVNTQFFVSPEDRPSLKVLILDECHWLSDNKLKHLISYPNLEIISLIGCLPKQSLSLSSLFNVAWNLKIIDGRLANIDDGYLSQNLTRPRYVSIPMQSLQCVYFENSVLTNQGTRVLRLCAAMLNQTINFTPPYRSSLYVDPIQECSCGYEEPSKQLSVATDNIDRARIKLSLRYFNCVDLKCLSTINLDVLDLSGSRQCNYTIKKHMRRRPNCRVIHPDVCKCWVTTPELFVDLPKGYTSRYINTSESEAFMNWLYDTLIYIMPII